MAVDQSHRLFDAEFNFSWNVVEQDTQGADFTGTALTFTRHFWLHGVVQHLADMFCQTAGRSGVAADHADETGHNDASNDAVGKRVTEGNTGVQTLTEVRIQFVFAQTLLSPVAGVNIDTVNVEFRMSFEELQEFSAGCIDCCKSFRSNRHRSVVPADAAVNVWRKVSAGFDHDRSGRFTDRAGFNSRRVLNFDFGHGLRSS